MIGTPTYQNVKLSWEVAADFMTRHSRTTNAVAGSALGVAWFYSQQPILQGITFGMAVFHGLTTTFDSRNLPKFNSKKSLSAHATANTIFAVIGALVAVAGAPDSRVATEANALADEITRLEHSHPRLGFQEKSFTLPSGQNVSITFANETVDVKPTVLRTLASGRPITLADSQCPATAIYTVAGNRIIKKINVRSIRDFLTGANILKPKSEDLKASRQESCSLVRANIQALVRSDLN